MLLLVALVMMMYNVAQPSAAERLILTLPETTDKKELERWMQSTKPGGVMLLAYHVSNRSTTKGLCTFLQLEARRYTKKPLLIAIDWEGGIVSRPSEAGGFTSIPSPWALARGGAAACYKAGVLIGSQMHDVGINLNFAPSLDLYGSRVLATRPFDSDPAVVAACGLAFCRGMLAAGVMPVLKHFPGLGGAAADTHFAAVEVDATDTARKPFDLVLSRFALPLMVTHATARGFDTKLPLTKSVQAVALFRKMYPKVPLITDDMCMRAAGAGEEEIESVYAALEAGYDYVIYSAPAPRQEALVSRLASKGSYAEPMNQIVVPQHKIQIDYKDESAVATHLARECLYAGLLPKGLNLYGKKVVMLTVDLARIRTPEKWFIAAGKSFLHEQLATRGVNVIREYIFNPLSDESIEAFEDAIYQQAKDTIFVVQTFFYADNKWNQRQEQWLRALRDHQHVTVIINLGFDAASALLPDAGHVQIGSFHKPLLDVCSQELAAPPMHLGADELVFNIEKYLTGKKFGLVANNTSYDSQDRFLPDILSLWADDQKDETELVALFAPEHGFGGNKEAFGHVDDESHSRWGCPIYSLHGATKKPTPAMLAEIDTLIVDLPDIGMRCFTYLSTLDLVMQACSEQGVDVIVLERPNPLRVYGQAGDLLEAECRSFVGRVDIPFLHARSIGAIGRQLAKKYSTNLKVLGAPQKNLYCGLRSLRAPSPNLASIESLLAYPITVFFEGTNYSEGRGTNEPFALFGAPHVSSSLLARRLNALRLTGLLFEPAVFTPRRMPGRADNPKHKDIRCGGARVHILAPELVQPYDAAQKILQELFTLYPHNSQCIRWGSQYGLDLLAGTKRLREQLMRAVYKEQKHDL